MEVNIQKYQAFIMSAETGSFTKAAEELNFTQSGISKMIADLEEDWDVVLFERSKRQIRLTADGKLLLPYAKSLCLEFDRVQQHVKDLHSYNSGLLRIGTISSVATVWLPEIIKRFHEDYPDIDYEFHIGDYHSIKEWIDDGKVDCGFLRITNNMHLDLDYISFYKDQMMVILPEDHEYANMESFPVKKLSDYPFIFFNRITSVQLFNLINIDDLNIKVYLNTWDDYAIMAMVEAGLGISVLPESIVLRRPYKIRAIPLSTPLFSEIGFVARNIDTIPTVVREFARYLDKHIR